MRRKLEANVRDGRTRRDRSSDLSVPSLGNSGSYPRRRSSPRLGTFDYTAGHRYHLTIITHGRRPIFAHAHWAPLVQDEIGRVARDGGFEVDAFCIMPDHLHVLVWSDAASEARVPEFVRRFKQRFGYAYKRVTGESAWQRSYYDHVLRSSEVVDEVAQYIFQ